MNDSRQKQMKNMKLNFRKEKKRNTIKNSIKTRILLAVIADVGVGV